SGRGRPRPRGRSARPPRRALGIAPERRPPRFATRTFRDWLAARPASSRPDGRARGRRVVLWADTFNTYFHPEVAIAAVEMREAPDFAPAPLGRRALVHLHCHQKATSDPACDLRVLERLGVDAEVLDSGCCGLAGSFGYEAGEPYDVAMKAGERLLLPAVRDAD